MAMYPARASSTLLLTSSCSVGGSLKCSVTRHGAPEPRAGPTERTDEGVRGRGGAADEEGGARRVACEEESAVGKERSAALGEERGAKTEASELGRVEESLLPAEEDAGAGSGGGGRREGWVARWW